jgi:hypothetical protein
MFTVQPLNAIRHCTVHPFLPQIQFPRLHFNYRKLLTLIVTIRKVVSAKRGGKRSPSMPERSKCRGGHFAMVT